MYNNEYAGTCTCIYSSKCQNIKLAANRIYTSTEKFTHISINNLQQNILIISLIRSPFEQKVNRMNW